MCAAFVPATAILLGSSAGLGSQTWLGQLLPPLKGWPGFVRVLCLRLQWVMNVSWGRSTVMQLASARVAVLRAPRGVAMVVSLALRGAPKSLVHRVKLASSRLASCPSCGVALA